MSPEQFASTTCADLQLPSNFAAVVASSIRQQLQHAWALIRHAGSRERESHPLLPRHVVLRVDVLFNGQRFRDDIRWDTRCPRNTPESVARQTCTDLSLLKPFDAAIAFAMRRELMRAALGCAAVDPGGTARLAAPATMPRQDSLMQAWRPRSLSVPLASRNGKAVSTLPTSNAKTIVDKNNGRLPHEIQSLNVPTSAAATPQGVGTMTHISGLDVTVARSGSSASSCVDASQSVAIERAPRAINPYIMFSSRHRGHRRRPFLLRERPLTCIGPNVLICRSRCPGEPDAQYCRDITHYGRALVKLYCLAAHKWHLFCYNRIGF